MRAEFELTNKVSEIVSILSEGVPDAKTIVYRIMNKDPFLILILDDMNIRGQQLLDAYYYCNNNIDRLILRIKSRSLKLVEYLNTLHEHKAVTSGGQYARKEEKRRDSTV